MDEVLNVKKWVQDYDKYNRDEKKCIMAVIIACIGLDLNLIYARIIGKRYLENGDNNLFRYKIEIVTEFSNIEISTYLGESEDDIVDKIIENDVYEFTHEKSSLIPPI